MPVWFPLDFMSTTNSTTGPGFGNMSSSLSDRKMKKKMHLEQRIMQTIICGERNYIIIRNQVYVKSFLPPWSHMSTWSSYPPPSVRLEKKTLCVANWQNQKQLFFLLYNSLETHPNFGSDFKSILVGRIASRKCLERKGSAILSIHFIHYMTYWHSCIAFIEKQIYSLHFRCFTHRQIFVYHLTETRIVCLLTL
jgi:hypothetical protein